MNVKWVWPERLAEEDDELRGFSRIEREILKARNVETLSSAERFLDHDLDEEDDPFLLEGVETAVKRIVAARKKGERVLVYGDYDADGITATAILVEALRNVGVDTSYFIPERLEQGYGLHARVLQLKRSEGIDLVISVDCGIRAIEAIEKANEVGLDVIITDHHEVGELLPQALAIINPKQNGDKYPFKGFAGAGLAYKLAKAVLQELNLVEERSLLDLVAIGTVADLAPLIDENRGLVIKGLQQLMETQRAGLVALSQASGVAGQRMRTETIAFSLGPRINAIGRLDNASKAVELLLTDDVSLAFKLAAELDQMNRERQNLTADIVELARRKIEEGLEYEDVLFVSDETFHEGIIGLAASRLSDEYYRPAIVANTRDDIARASARSIPGFNITGALEECSDILVRFGGHHAAAGFSLKTKDIRRFQERINHVARERMKDIDLVPTVEIETEVRLDELDFNLLAFLDKIQPCGVGNPTPLMGARDVRVTSSRSVGKGGKHLKLMLKQGGHLFDSIAFNQGDLLRRLTPTIDIAFYFERNDFRGIEGRQLNIRAIKTH